MDDGGWIDVDVNCAVWVHQIRPVALWPCGETMTAWLALQVLSTLLILRFDGSWKYPRDPDFPTSSLGRMAACAACILVTPSEQTKGSNGASIDRVAHVGGRQLDARIVRGSAQSEYEALLFGLEGLLRLHRSETDAPVLAISSSTTLTIEGDCKTILNQLAGISEPRKLNDYYNRAVALIQELPCKFRYKHIPRDENVLCDRICAKILERQQAEALKRAHKDLHSLCLDTGASPVVHAPESLLSAFLQRHFSPGQSCIPISRRPALYRKMAAVASRIRDFGNLVTIGQMMETECKMLWPTVRASTLVSPRADEIESDSTVRATVDQRFRDILMVDALVYQLKGLRHLKKLKEEVILRRKNRHILEKYNGYAETVFKTVLADESLHLSPPSTVSELQASPEHTRISEWPPLVTQWYDRAVLDLSWRGGTQFWMPLDLHN